MPKRRFINCLAAAAAAAAAVVAVAVVAYFPRRGNGGDRDPRRRGQRKTQMTLHCHYHNDLFIQMSSDESHLNVSITAGDKITISVHTPQLLNRKTSRTKWNRDPASQSSALPIGQQDRASGGVSKVNMVLNVHGNHEAH